MMRKTGALVAGTVWFGAAVSIAEIEAGCRIAGNWPALVLGHLLGGFLLFATGLIGARSGLNAMETARGTFGGFGVGLFAALNVLQLVGWTAVMIAQGSLAAGRLTGTASTPWCVPLAALVVLWMLFGRGGASRLGMWCVGLLAALCLALTVRLSGAAFPAAAVGEVRQTGFWTAFEISVALPLSWLPLVSDYTKDAARPFAVAAVSAGTYTVVSLWMFALGSLLIGSGCTDPVDGISRSGRGLAAVGLPVVLFSTTITTYFDVNSSGESLHAIFKSVRPKAIGFAVAAIGAILAGIGIMERFVGFLEWIASVFAPMAAVLLVDRYLVKRGRAGWNLFAWFVGFAVYHVLSFVDSRSTLSALAASATVAAFGRRK